MPIWQQTGMSPHFQLFKAMHSHTIQKASQEDLILVRKIAYGTWPICYKEIVSHDQIQYMLNYMYDLDELKQQHERGVIFMLLTDENIAAGFIAFEKVTREAKMALRVHKLYVLPEFHKKKYGKALLEEAIHFAREYHLSFLELNVNKQNPAVDFYKRMGFQVADTMVLDIGNGYIMDDYVMVLKI